jgi:ankyrin repeat protein
MEAAETGKIALVQLLLNAGADKRRRTKEGMSAYDVALAGGFEEMAALLK